MGAGGGGSDHIGHIAEDHPLYGVEDGSGGSASMSPAPQVESPRASGGPKGRPLATAAGATLERSVDCGDSCAGLRDGEL